MPATFADNVISFPGRQEAEDRLRASRIAFLRVQVARGLYRFDAATVADALTAAGALGPAAEPTAR